MSADMEMELMLARATEYERYCVAHAKTMFTNCEAFHWPLVPELYLIESGWLRRPGRIARHANGDYCDYGLDGMLRVDGKHYVGLQSKLYIKSTLKTQDIDTFVYVLIDSMVPKFAPDRPSNIPAGLLFAPESTRLHSQLAASLDKGMLRNIVGIKLCRLNMPLEEEVVELVLPEQNRVMTMRPHQIRALHDIQSTFSDEHSRCILAMACGTGKTLVADECFKDSLLLVITAPLIALCEQIADRVAARDSSIEVIRAWSASTTGCSSDEIEASLVRAIATGHRVILLVTYTSASQALEALLDTGLPFDAFIDEAHNANDDVHELARSADRALFLTATPTEELVRDAGGIPIGHALSMRESIDTKLTCEYELIIPLATDAVGLGLDVEISNFRGGDEWAARAFFLVGQMLNLGRRRCVVFLESQERCSEFGKLLVDVCKNHFGVKMTALKITSECSASVRREALVKFESPLMDRVIELRALCAVRIMDEGQDVPMCDSIFWANAPSSTDSGKIRVVQQLSRALRLCDGKTMASAFIWTPPDNIELADMLERLRAEDPELGSRVRVVSGAYDKLDDVEFREQVRTVQLANTDAFVCRFRLAGLSFLDAARDNFMLELEAYRAREGHVRVPQLFVAANGYKLGDTVSRVRAGRFRLPTESLELLRGMGFVWDALSDRRDAFLRELGAFYASKGHVRVPFEFVATSGYKLGVAVSNARKHKIIQANDAPRMDRLRELGFEWHIQSDILSTKRDNFLRELGVFHAREGHSLVPNAFITTSGYALGSAVSQCRSGKLVLPDDAPRRARLLELGFVWDARSHRRDEFLRELGEFHAIKGHSNVPANFVSASGFKLGAAVSQCRIGHLVLPEDSLRRARLLELGFVWDALEEKRDTFLRELGEFHAIKGHSRVHHAVVTASGYKLGVAVSMCRRGHLVLPGDAPRLARLRELNFIWNARKRAR